MIEGFIKSKTRVKLLIKFFINPKTSSYLRELSDEFCESTNAVRVELNSLTEAKILNREKDKNKVSYSANIKHPLFDDIRSIILKTIGIDKVISNLLENIGDPDKVILTGDYARGIDAGIIDIAIVGKDIKKYSIEKYTNKVESLIDRKLRTLLLSPDEYIKYKDKLKTDGMIILWENTNGSK